jgi:membrane fusion protein (multidrug efflux system)
MDPILAQVAVDRARAAIARAASEGTLAGANLQRNQGLANMDATSRARLDEAENAARLAHAAKLEARAALAEAEDSLAKKTIRAPFAGVLRSFPVEEGEYVRPGERIAELLDVDRLRITIGLTDRQVVAIRPGARVKLEVDAMPGQPIEGEVVRVGGAIDLSTRKFPARIEIDNADGRLLPGMVARVDVALAETRSAMTVPLDAVVEEYGLRHVFVVERVESQEGADAADGGDRFRVARRRVEAHAIPFRPTELEVQAGLTEGERIAISSVRQLRDGMAVRPLPPARSAALTTGESAP